MGTFIEYAYTRIIELIESLWGSKSVCLERNPELNRKDPTHYFDSPPVEIQDAVDP